MICLISQFDWEKFEKSINPEHRIYRKLILNLQQLQTGDLIGFSDIPEKCLRSLDLSRLSRNKIKETNIRSRTTGKDRGIRRGLVRSTSGVISKK